MDFVKMHGLGNDFIVFDRRGDAMPLTPALVRSLCDRRRGVGADGVILLDPPGDPATIATMRIYNRDGTDGEVCGNGLRCVGALLCDRDGVSRLTIGIDGGRADIVRVSKVGESPEMFEVVLPRPDRRVASLPAAIPGIDPDASFIDRVVPDFGDAGIALPDDTRMTLVSVGCPHAVFVTDREDEVPIDVVGPAIDAHDWFPAGVNVHLVRRLTPGHLRMRTWERGAGPTLACGTGACAAAIADHWSGGAPAADGFTRVSMRGGDLWIGIDPSTEEQIRMRGPAVEVARGVLTPSWIAESQSETPS